VVLDTSNFSSAQPFVMSSELSVWTTSSGEWVCKYMKDWILSYCLYSVRVRVRVTLQLTVSQSVRLGVEPCLGLMTRYLFLYESCCPVYMGRPLWREDGSVVCLYSALFCHLLKAIAGSRYGLEHQAAVRRPLASVGTAVSTYSENIFPLFIYSKMMIYCIRMDQWRGYL
jgi:hypothetical protein